MILSTWWVIKFMGWKEEMDIYKEKRQLFEKGRSSSEKYSILIRCEKMRMKVIINAVLSRIFDGICGFEIISKIIMKWFLPLHKLFRGSYADKKIQKGEHDICARSKAEQEFSRDQFYNMNMKLIFNGFFRIEDTNLFVIVHSFEFYNHLCGRIPSLSNIHTYLFIRTYVTCILHKHIHSHINRYYTVAYIQCDS